MRCEFHFAERRSKGFAGHRIDLKNERQLGTIAQRVALLLLTGSLAGCAGIGGGTDDRGAANQPYPANYRTEVLAFLKTYLNNPENIRDASLAEPVERTVGGRQRYVVCLRYNAREADGSYRGARERAVVFIDGRLDRINENAGDSCAGVSYAPYPELEKMKRYP
jgi:hypothetical protein